MAGFHTHIAVSTASGIAYGWWGTAQLGLPLPTCLLAGGLCSISGMFPDLDSDSGVPARETISFAAAVVPMLAFHRLHLHGLSVEQMVVAGAPMYLFIRFGLGSLLKKFTVHRGMFHSLPALAIAAMITFLLCDDGLTMARFFKAGGVALGFFSHLLLDEIWSVNLAGKRPVVKKSFGSALKLFGPSAAGNSAAYGLLILTSLLVLQDAHRMPSPMPNAPPLVAPDEDEPPRTRHATRRHRDVIYE
jgi:membrane-bound metal-dependent hydrolase YbcI (DUF457 family)